MAEGVHGIIARIEKRRVEVFFPGLLFFRSAMVVDGKENGALFFLQALPK
jgi:hypothetical protein